MESMRDYNNSLMLYNIYVYKSYYLNSRVILLYKTENTLSRIMEYHMESDNMNDEL
jgi:hypothetical protein